MLLGVSLVVPNFGSRTNINKGARMAVKAAYAEAMSMSWNLNILSGPKMTITCGKCLCTFTDRPPKVNYPRVPCPHCNELNIIPFIYE
jgi:hypothetical protein